MTTKTELMQDFLDRTITQDVRRIIKFQGKPVTRTIKMVYDKKDHGFYNYKLILKPCIQDQLYIELTRIDSYETNEYYRECLYYGVMKPYNHYKKAEIHWEKISIYVDIINKRK